MTKGEGKKKEFSITCNIKPHLKWLPLIQNHWLAIGQEIVIIAYPLAVSYHATHEITSIRFTKKESKKETTRQDIWVHVFFFPELQMAISFTYMYVYLSMTIYIINIHNRNFQWCDFFVYSWLFLTFWFTIYQHNRALSHLMRSLF